jgi:hypothetical protein
MELGVAAVWTYERDKREKCSDPLPRCVGNANLRELNAEPERVALACGAIEANPSVNEDPPNPFLLCGKFLLHSYDTLLRSN